MHFKVILLVSVLICTNIFASDHGMYLRIFSNVQENIETVSSKIEEKIKNSNIFLLYHEEAASLNIVREDINEHCSYKARLLIFSAKNYTRMLTSFGNKYLCAGFIRIGIFENENGVQVVLSDPETINRIIFNDLPDDKYEELVAKSKQYKSNLIKTLHTLEIEHKVQEARKPIRSDKALRKASKDMIMMVGKMTFFKNEKQFPIIYSHKSTEGKAGLEKLKKEIFMNLGNFKPSQKDVDYDWCESPNQLHWKVVSEIYSPDSTAVLLGIMRDRTTALSFHIAGMKREEDNNSCPGIDHIAAYPIEVLIMLENDEIIVRTPREMFRMDMYFWDAGKWAFMKFMNMPKTLDESIKKALFGG